MAAPDISYTDLLQVAHEQGVGFRFRGFEVTSKELLYSGSRDIWAVTVVKAGSTWTAHYTTTITGTIGKIYQVQDDEGRWWYHDALDGWR